MKIRIGWTVLKDGKAAIGQAEGSYSSRLSRHVTPVYDSIRKARRAAIVRGLPYENIVEAFVEVPDPVDAGFVCPIDFPGCRRHCGGYGCGG